MSRSSKKTAIGIDISLDAVRVVELQFKKSLRLQNMNAQPLGLGALGRDSGVNWVGVDNTLRQVLKDFKVKGKRAHVAIPSALTVIRQLSLPDFADDELREVIEFELTNSIHLPFADAVFDFVRCPKSEDDERDGNISVILIAADRAFVEMLVKCLRGIGVRVVDIDVRSLATYRVLKRLGSLSKTFVLVESDRRGTKIHVFHDGLLYLTRQVAVELIKDRVEKSEVGADVGRLDDLSGSLQADIRNTADTSFQANASLQENAAEEARNLAVEQLSNTAYVTRMGDELDRTMNFFRYTLNQRSAEFHEIIFTGSTAITADVTSALSERVGVPVRELSFQNVIESNIVVGRRGMVLSEDEALNDYTVAIGLALREV